MSHRFIFNARGYGKPVQPLGVEFTQKPSGSPVVAHMLAEGMLPLPNHLQSLPRHELADAGYPFIRWSKKHGMRYLPVSHKRHDT